MKFRLIDTGLNTPGINMAIDEALLSSELPVLRFYSWKPAGLSLGYFQATKDIDTDYCKKNNIEVVRRLTGGNAVLHEKELTYSFIIDANLMPFDIVESYKKISKGIMAGLNNLGLAPELSEHGTEEAGSAVCFEEPSWYEMTINNKKIVGSAQKRIDGKVLQHGAVLIDLDILKYARCFTGFTAEMCSNLQKRITSINSETGIIVSYAKLAEAMRKGFEEALDIEFEEDTLTDEEIKTAIQLNNEKYSNKSWNDLR